MMGLAVAKPTWNYTMRIPRDAEPTPRGKSERRKEGHSGAARSSVTSVVRAHVRAELPYEATLMNSEATHP